MFSGTAERLGGIFDFASGFAYLRGKSKSQLLKEHWEAILQWYKDKGFEWVLQVPPTLSEVNGHKNSGFSPFRLFKSRESYSIQHYAKAIPELNDTPIPNALDEIINILKDEDSLEKIESELNDSNDNTSTSPSDSNETNGYRKAATSSNSQLASNFEILKFFKISSTTNVRASDKPLSLEYLRKADFFRILMVMADFNIPVGMHSKVIDTVRYMLEQISSTHSVIMEQPYDRKQLISLLSNSYHTICTLRRQSKNHDAQLDLETCFVHLVEVVVNHLKTTPNHISAFLGPDNFLFSPKPFALVFPLVSYLLDFIPKEDYIGFLARDILVKSASIILPHLCPSETDFPLRLMSPLISKQVDEATYFSFLSKFCFSLGNSPLTHALASILPFSPSFFNVKPIHPTLLYNLHDTAINLLESLEKDLKKKKAYYPSVPNYTKDPHFLMKSFLYRFSTGSHERLENYLFDLNLQVSENASGTLRTDTAEIPMALLLSLWGSNIDSILATSLFKFWKVFLLHAPYTWVEWFLVGPGKNLVIERTSNIAFSTPGIAQTIQSELSLILYAKFTFHTTLQRCKLFVSSDQFKLFKIKLRISMAHTHSQKRKSRKVLGGNAVRFYVDRIRQDLINKNSIHLSRLELIFNFKINLPFRN